MKIVLVIAGLVAAVSAKDLIVGHEGGSKIFEQNVTASPAIWRQTRNLTVSAAENEVITRVVVVDNREDKNGEAAIVEGGEGHQNVTIELKSPAVFRGYDFEVQVYAKHEDGAQQETQDNNQQTSHTDLTPDTQVNEQQVPQQGNDGLVTPGLNTQAPKGDKEVKLPLTPGVNTQAPNGDKDVKVPVTEPSTHGNGQQTVQHPTVNGQQEIQHPSLVEQQFQQVPSKGDQQQVAQRQIPARFEKL